MYWIGDLDDQACRYKSKARKNIEKKIHKDTTFLFLVVLRLLTALRSSHIVAAYQITRAKRFPVATVGSDLWPPKAPRATRSRGSRVATACDPSENPQCLVSDHRLFACSASEARCTIRRAPQVFDSPLFDGHLCPMNMGLWAELSKVQKKDRWWWELWVYDRSARSPVNDASK